jgi:hypothetical protein
MNALLVASRSPDQATGGWSPIGRLQFEEGTYRFVYTKGAKTAQGFTPFSGEEFQPIPQGVPACCGV